MRMRNQALSRAALVLGALVLGALGAATPAPAQPNLACPVIETRNWTARIEADPFTDEMRLVVYGQLLMPTPGFSLELQPTVNAKSYPPIQFFDLAIRPPAGDLVAQALSWQDVVYEGPADAPAYRMVKIHCDGREIASIANIEAQRRELRDFGLPPGAGARDPGRIEPPR